MNTNINGYYDNEIGGLYIDGINAYDAYKAISLEAEARLWAVTEGLEII